MSLEEAMKELAESNRELAAAQRKYAEVIIKNGVQVVSAAGSKTGSDDEDEPKPETAAAKKKREAAEAAAKAKAKPKVSDGLDDDEEEEEEEEETKISAEDVKAKLVELRTKTGDKQASLDIMAKFGYEKVGDIQEKDYAKIVTAVDKALKKA